MKLYLKPILLSGLPEDPDDPGGNDPFHPPVGSQIGVPEDGAEGGGTRSVNLTQTFETKEVFSAMSADEPMIDSLSDGEALIPDVAPSIEIPTVYIPLE